MIDQVEEKSFRLNTFEKIDGKYTGKIGNPINTSGKFETGFLLGQWTFGHLLGNMVGEQDDPMDFLKHFLSQWTFEQTINGWPTDKKRKIFNGINTSFAKLPFRLLAIGNRLDLFKATSVHDVHDAGEGRFVFCMTGSFSEVEEEGFWLTREPKLILRLFSNMDKRLPILKICLNGLKVGINYQCLEVTLKLIHLINTSSISLRWVIDLLKEVPTPTKPMEIQSIK